ncbi:MAG: TonB-dependent receptor plug domain-containing protein [Vicinamibacteraceae bacterium]
MKVRKRVHRTRGARQNWHWLLALVAVTAASGKAVAQTPPPVREEVIVTATAAPVPFDAVARPVAVVTREQIADLPVRSVPELLRFALGVDVRARGPFGSQTDYGLRGAGFGQTLVLVDGVRLNDAQSGHHNGDLPVPLEDVERVEVMLGAGSSLHGADAFGGTVNIITRSDASRWEARVATGQHGLVQAGGSGALRQGARTFRLSGAIERSDGFMFARDFRHAVARMSAQISRGTKIAVAHLDKEFGANGFYGPAPSREWTSQTLVSSTHEARLGRRWESVAQLFYRTHGDRFLYDVRQPGQFENRHRTHAAGASLEAHYRWAPGRRLSLGTEVAGDWLDSSNLGAHRIGRGSVFAELQQPLGRVLFYPALRVDAYSRYGTAWSPSLGVTAMATQKLKWRTSVGRAFRAPTFTELYYTDPNHLASSDLQAETAWSADVGLDYLVTERWSASGTVFLRREENVIDWIRASPDERWRTSNIRRLNSGGVEVGISGRHSRGGWLGVQYSWLRTRARDLSLLSKYALDYAPHTVALWGSADVGAGIIVGPRIEYKRRTDGQRYWVVDARVSRRFGRVGLFIEASNLLDADYREVAGVDMPGRWLRAGLELR